MCVKCASRHLKIMLCFIGNWQSVCIYASVVLMATMGLVEKCT